MAQNQCDDQRVDDADDWRCRIGHERDKRCGAGRRCHGHHVGASPPLVRGRRTSVTARPLRMVAIGPATGNSRAIVVVVMTAQRGPWRLRRGHPGHPR
jgi:hypothetical protein